MAAADMNVWRRQNSDSIAVELILIDGSRLKGIILLSRDKTMREFFNMAGEAFIDFDCKRDGMIVIAKASVRQIRAEDVKKKDDQVKIDAVIARLAELEKTDPNKILGVAPGANQEDLRKAYIAKARAYHPDRFIDSELPSEVLDYLNAMARRINTAYENLEGAMTAMPKTL